jgi:3-hydroxyacyl-[acyl-carrier-protein] dehydratase
MSGETGVIDIMGIMKMLPHRYPFLLVDRVVRCTPGEFLEAYKNVTINEPFFQGHFPGLPVMPGVLVLEALAQAGGLLLFNSTEEDLSDKVLLFTGMDKVRFRRPVRPGDKLVLRLEDFKRKLNLLKIKGQAMVDEQLVAEAMLTAAVVDREDI